ncbi:unnamed protein product [Arabidopsis lyrata]|uniref:F-box family protein n=1 Tax=Arabidopsis lyrata subsp. lyrata TaxID=81972 RepID=D7L1H4_ARALL|nr:F-box/kelch-repeat protein At3g13680 [Arabidopsis lyrata subsp. lyrata]EFH61240.1 F-box family protein [Arabidopsis lyrata subsp. lyrata]CAH8260369.1 unnamed protein product [Arabidopsis lyrata]|eukprot:XP_002884981.1 F-box/kelch-repeat protein At3g13680 [Arabidopsis lyrata subsp. lyrata]
MTTMGDLPGDLVEEILSRVPLTSLRAIRSTCKKWNSLSKNQICGKKATAARKQFMGFMMKDSRLCSIEFDLQGIRNDDGNFVDPSIKQVNKLDQFEVSQVFHCDGLVLCIIKDKTGLLVWNPYLGQTRSIQPRNNFQMEDRYALGYDNNRNYKILRIFDLYPSRNRVFGYEVYDFSSNSWKLLDVNPGWDIQSHHRGVSLKGNTYFPAQKKKTEGGIKTTNIEDVLLCFDFTSERFGPPLPLPFHSYNAEIFVSLSCVREEQLAMLYQRWEACETIEICVTNKIDPNTVSWSKFLITFTGFPVDTFSGSFFIDEEKKVAVVFDLDRYKPTETCRYQIAHIIGQDEYFKSVNIGVAPNLAISYKVGFTPTAYCVPLVCSSSYVPSLVQLQINKPGKRKESS